MTHTYVSFFLEDDKDIQKLNAHLDNLSLDFEHRAPHINPRVVRQGQERLQAVRLAVARLLDRVAD